MQQMVKDGTDLMIRKASFELLVNILGSLFLKFEEMLATNIRSFVAIRRER